MSGTTFSKSSPTSFCSINLGKIWCFGENYRFTFNGKETEPIFGEGFSDFGARIYDGRLGRWLSCDPLERKYPGISNFNFSFNSPILYKDCDGRDALATVDKKDGTKENPHVITITAVFYYNPQQLNSVYSNAEENLKFAIDSYNKTELTIQDENGVFYKVKFEISSIPVEQSEPDEILNANKKSSTYTSKDGSEISYGNVVGQDILSLNKYNVNPRETPAVTEKGKVSLLKAGLDPILNKYGNNISEDQSPIDFLGDAIRESFKHEIGHVLGLIDNYEGKRTVMAAVTIISGFRENCLGQGCSYNVIRNNEISDKDIRTIAKQALAGTTGEGQSNRVIIPTSQKN